MKQKYVALILGLTLAVSSMGVYAEEAGDAAVTEAAREMELSEENTLYGEVKEIGDDSITIAVGTVKVDEEQPVKEQEDAGDAADDTAKADMTEDEFQNAAAETDTLAETDGAADSGRVFVPTGEEETISFTENTLFYKETDVLLFQEEEPEDAGAEEANEAFTEEEATEENSVVLKQDAESPEVSDENVEKPEAAEKNTEEASIQKVPTVEISAEDLAEGDVLRITLDEDGNAETVMVLMSDPEGENEEEIQLLEDLDANTEDSEEASEE